jgi:hypothetical protein
VKSRKAKGKLASAERNFVMAVRLDCGLDGLNRFFAVKFRAGIGWSILG